MATDPIAIKNIIYAVLGGVVPAVFWLWFWLKEEDPENREPKLLVFITFIIGAIAVIFTIAVQKFSTYFFENGTTRIVIWAAIEEILKSCAAMLIIVNSRVIRKPIDYPMYFIACALGFAAFENVLYLLEPLATNGTLVGALTGNLRFLGSTLLHAIASGMIGSALGLAYFRDWISIRIYFVIGLILAIILHSVFNFFIMKGSGENFLQVFGFVWITAIINILIFEKLKRMGGEPES